jgi:hypothetical protein
MQSQPSSLAAPPIAFSHAESARHFAVLSVVSFGIYPPYWLYKNLKAIKAHRDLAIRPGWRTFGAFIPLIGLLFFKDQLQLFADTAATAGVEASYSPWARTLGFSFVSLMAEMPHPWWIVALASVLFLLPVQEVLNAYWEVEQPGRPMRQGYSAGETALLVVCGVVWVLIIALSMVGDSTVVAAM